MVRMRCVLCLMSAVWVGSVLGLEVPLADSPAELNELRAKIQKSERVCAQNLMNGVRGFC